MGKPYFGGRPISQQTAKQLKEYKSLNGMCYAKLGSLVGVSGNTLSSRIVHCEGSQHGELNASGRVHRLIENFLEKHTSKSELARFETLEIVQELQRRGAKSIVF